MTTSSSLAIHRATVDDAAAIGEVHVAAWRWAYRGLLPDELLDDLSVPRRAAAWYDIIEKPKRGEVVFVARDPSVVGFVCVGPSRDRDGAGIGEVFAINLQQSAAGRGIGRALLARGTEELARCGFSVATLWVLAHNARARRFYEIDAWRVDGARQSQMHDDVEAEEVRYRKALG